jgi:Tol biopolymer transport system component
LFSFGAWPTGIAHQGSVYICASDGSQLRPVTDILDDWVNPSWSPTDDRIVFQLVYGGAYTVTLDRATPRLLVGGLLSHVRWVPDGRHVIASNWPNDNYESDLTVYDIETGSSVQITHHEPGYSYNYASYSPDGTRLAVAAMDPNLGKWKVVAMNADGTGQQFLTSNWTDSSDGGPTWTPDGKWILFSSDYGGPHDIWAMRPDGTGRVQLTHTPEQEAAPFAMRPPLPVRLGSTPRVDAGAQEVHFTLCGDPGRAVPLEMTTDFQKWESARAITIPDSGCADVVWPWSDRTGGFFFRAASPSP